MCDWRLSHLILVTYASSQWRGKKFLIEHVVNVKTPSNKGNNKITELRTILQRESQNS